MEAVRSPFSRKSSTKNNVRKLWSTKPTNKVVKNRSPSKFSSNNDAGNSWARKSSTKYYDKNPWRPKTNTKNDATNPWEGESNTYSDARNPSAQKSTKNRNVRSPFIWISSKLKKKTNQPSEPSPQQFFAYVSTFDFHDKMQVTRFPFPFN